MVQMCSVRYGTVSHRATTKSCEQTKPFSKEMVYQAIISGSAASASL